MFCNGGIVAAHGDNGNRDDLLDGGRKGRHGPFAAVAPVKLLRQGFGDVGKIDPFGTRIDTHKAVIAESAHVNRISAGVLEDFCEPLRLLNRDALVDSEFDTIDKDGDREIRPRAPFDFL